MFVARAYRNNPDTGDISGMPSKVKILLLFNGLVIEGYVFLIF